jgi:hypothetical protein
MWWDVAHRSEDTHLLVANVQVLKMRIRGLKTNNGVTMPVRFFIK